MYLLVLTIVLYFVHIFGLALVYIGMCYSGTLCGNVSQTKNVILRVL
jgi:hypothetical protein